MINYLMELIMFFTPGLLTELLFCFLKSRHSTWWIRLIRILLFSLACLVARCLISVMGGHGSLEISVIFHGIGNFLKYCVISGFEIVFLPPCLLIVEKLLPWNQDVNIHGEEK